MPDFDSFCRWFPTLNHHFGGDIGPNITEEKLVEFLQGPAATSGSSAAARFCLAIWNHYNYDFDIKDISSWDREHLHAFQIWASKPFWY